MIPLCVRMSALLNDSCLALYSNHTFFFWLNIFGRGKREGRREEGNGVE